MSVIENNITRPQLESTTSGREGAAIVGTDAKTNLGSATTAEAALTWLDSWVATTDDAIENLTDRVVDLETAVDVIGAGTADLFGFNDFRTPGDPFEIRSNYGLTVTREGDIYFIDSTVLSGDIPTITAGTGINVGLAGNVYTISCTLTLPTVSGGQGITVAVSGSDYKIHVREARVALTDGATVTLDCANDNRFILTMDSARPNRILALSNISVGQIITLILKQGTSAGNTVTWWSGNNWPNAAGPTLTNSNNQSDVFTFECLSSGVYLALVSGQNIANM